MSDRKLINQLIPESSRNLPGMPRVRQVVLFQWCEGTGCVCVNSWEFKKKILPGIWVVRGWMGSHCERSCCYLFSMFLFLLSSVCLFLALLLVASVSPWALPGVFLGSTGQYCHSSQQPWLAPAPAVGTDPRRGQPMGWGELPSCTWIMSTCMIYCGLQQSET